VLAGGSTESVLYATDVPVDHELADDAHELVPKDYAARTGENHTRHGDSEGMFVQ